MAVKKEDEDDKKKEDLKEDDVVVVEEDEKKKVAAKEGDKKGDKKADERTEDEKKEDEQEDARTAKGGEDLSEEERELIRERRREERRDRKERQREKAEEKDRLIIQMRQELEAVKGRQNQIDQRNFVTDMSRVDQGMRESIANMEEAKRIIAQATAEQKGEALAAAQEAWFEARAQYEKLSNYKQNVAYQQQQQKQSAPDPMIMTHAQAWMRKNSWYDPKGGDPDSMVALTVDKTLASEGWNPRTPQYWEEFNKRLPKYLPHRFKTNHEEEDDDSSITAGSGREQSTGKVTYRISAERVAALQQAGLWDDPETRKRMAKRYAQFDKDKDSDVK